MTVDLKSKLFSKPPKNGDFYIVASDGRGGAGKTTLTEYIETLLPGFSVLNGDEYFEPNDNTVAFGSFNEDRFEKDVLSQLREGKSEFIYYHIVGVRKSLYQRRSFKLQKELLSKEVVVLPLILIMILRFGLKLPPN